MLAFARPAALVERNYRAARRRGLIVLTGFVEPVFYLFALGIGIGALVGTIDVDGVIMPYAIFVAPAMMATSAMNGAVLDSTINVFHKIRHDKTYHSVLTTPLGPRDVAAAEIGWALLRGVMYSTAFLLVAALAGFVTSWWALLAIPACSLIGLAFAAVGMAVTTFMRSWNDMDYVQLATLPMFLFSATFFPLSTYPEAVQWVVQATPLFHGVELVRGLMTGNLHAGLGVHVLYLLVMGAVGLWATTRRVALLLLK